MAKATLSDFISQHPFCCFCGGQKNTESRDEVPPRTLFFERQWPEGYRFPSCHECNQSSRLIDQALGLIGRLSYADAYSDVESITPHIFGVANNSPSLLPKTPKSSIEAKKILRSLGIEKPAGMFAVDVPIALVSKETIDALDPFFSKLFCALYYKHVGRILPKASKIAIAKTTNQILDQENPFGWQVIPAQTFRPQIQRAGKSLHEQFDYNWTYNSEEDLFGFNFQIRFSLFGIMFGPVSDEFVAELPEDMLLTTGR